MRWSLPALALVAVSSAPAAARAQLRVEGLNATPPDRISVFTVRGEGVRTPFVVFQAHARRALEAHMHAEIVPMNEVLRKGGPELMKRLAACEGEPACYRDLVGTTLDAQFILILTATKIGDTRLVGARLVDLEALRVVGESIEEVPGDQSFADVLEARVQDSIPPDRWDPFGALEVDVNQPGAQISINGRVVGLSPVQTLGYLLPGAYEVRADKRGLPPQQTTVTVERGATARASLALPIVEAEEAGGSAWLLWAGLGAGAAAVTGAVLGVLLTQGEDRPPSFCTAPDPALCR